MTQVYIDPGLEASGPPFPPWNGSMGGVERGRTDHNHPQGAGGWTGGRAGGRTDWQSGGPQGAGAAGRTGGPAGGRRGGGGRPGGLQG